MLTARGIIGRRTKKSVKYKLLSNTTWRCSRTHLPRKTAQFASYKIQAAKLHNVALFKDPPAKEDCPICFLPMPYKLISCITLPPATIMSVPVYDFAIANEELADKAPEVYLEGVCTPSVSLVMMRSVHFAILTEAKQKKRIVKI
jgi:hypothetical protein